MNWNELNIDNELSLQRIDPECRMYEETLRHTIFQWKHFAVDMVLEPYIEVSKAIYNTGYCIA